MSLLAHSVGLMPLALLLPDSAVFSVVELWWSNNLNPVPSESSGGATGVPVLAVTVLSLLWANGSVSLADGVVVDRSDDDNWLKLPSESLGSADSVPVLTS